MEKARIIENLVRILDAYEKGTVLISNQGQALDGYSALAEFVDLAREARCYLAKRESEEDE